MLYSFQSKHSKRALIILCASESLVVYYRYFQFLLHKYYSIIIFICKLKNSQTVLNALQTIVKITNTSCSNQLGSEGCDDAFLCDFSIYGSLKLYSLTIAFYQRTGILHIATDNLRGAFHRNFTVQKKSNPFSRSPGACCCTLRESMDSIKFQRFYCERMGKGTERMSKDFTFIIDKSIKFLFVWCEFVEYC